MAAGPRIAIDAMGGDAGPAAMIAGAARALRKDLSLCFTFYGDEQEVERLIATHRDLASSATIVHSAEAIAATEKPSQAIRRARTTSMGMAINAVKENIADAALSGGNTDRIGDALGVGAPVALHHQPVEAEEDRAVVVVGVEVDLQQVKRRTRQREPRLRSERAGEGAAEEIGHEASGTFRGL